MISIKPGGRLHSAVCDTQLMVVKGKGEFDLRCGGAALTQEAGTGAGEPAADFANGSLMGKRYVNEDGSLELLCTKPGAGSLSLGDTVLGIKQAQNLPSSD